MKRFDVTIQTSLGRRTFMFKPFFSIHGLLYQVTVFAQISNAYFLMSNNGGGWKFSKPHLLQNWIREVEAELIEAIKNNHAS